MNKDSKILKANYDEQIGVFVDILDVLNIEYAPYIKKSAR